MSELENGWVPYLALTGVKFLIALVVLGLIMVFVDPFYFEQPLAVAEAGMEPGQAPPPPFATSVVFPVEPGDPVKFALGARDQNTRARVEVLLPSGQALYDRELEITKPSTGARRQGWQTFSVGVPETGTYTIRITQHQAGMIKIFLFQGPFIARMLILPALAAFVVMVLGFLWRGAAPSPSTAVVPSRPAKES